MVVGIHKSILKLNIIFFKKKKLDQRARDKNFVAIVCTHNSWPTKRSNITCCTMSCSSNYLCTVLRDMLLCIARFHLNKDKTVTRNSSMVISTWRFVRFKFKFVLSVPGHWMQIPVPVRHGRRPSGNSARPGPARNQPAGSLTRNRPVV